MISETTAKRYGEVGLVYLKSFIRSIQFRVKDQVEFIDYLNSWLDAGATPLQATNAIAKAYPKRAVQRKVALYLIETLNAGGTLAEGMSTWFHPSVLTITAAGQQVSSEALAEGLRSFVEQEDEKKQLREEFTKPLKLPTFLLAVALLFLFGVGYFVIPGLANDDTDLPGLASFVMLFAGFIKNFWLAIVFALAALAVAFMFLIKHVTHPLRRQVFDQYLPGSLIKDFIAARYITTLSLLVKYGKTPLNAGKLMMRHATRYEKFHLRHLIETAIRGEERVYVLLDSGIFSKTSFMRLRILSEAPGQAGKEEALSRLASGILSDIRVTMKSVRIKCLIGAYVLLAAVVITAVISIIQVVSATDLL